MARHFDLLRRTGVPAGVFAVAIGAALAADSVPESPTPEVIPSRRATKFLVRNESPAYPSIAKLNYIQGRVSVQATVNDAGEVKEVHVLKGHPFLAVAALKAIRNWLFRPARARQGPANFVTYLDVKFTLQTRRLNPFPLKPEDDLLRQVHPPEVASMATAGEPNRQVRMRVLVGADGRALDSVPLVAGEEIVREARLALADWTFRPARWGAVAVPWYIEVNVPLAPNPTAQGGGEFGTHLDAPSR